MTEGRPIGLSEKRMRIINLYHEHPEWSFNELVEVIYGEDDKRAPDLETDNLSKAKKWRRESLTRSGYNVELIYKKVNYIPMWRGGHGWRAWEKENFVKAIRSLEREQYLWEKWKGSHDLVYVKIVVGEHLMRVCRSQEEACVFKALLSEAVDIRGEKVNE